MKRMLVAAVLMACVTGTVHAQQISAKKISPNLEGNMDAPLRYRPEGTDFVIENGAEFFNRPLYGGNTAFRVDTGDKPEFVLYGLPGRGGNLRLGLKGATGAAKWLHMAASITARYRPGGMIYDIKDPILGAQGVLHIEAYALASTEGLIVRVEGQNTAPGVEWLWAYGGVNLKRGARDGDIGTESVPISEYFQLVPNICQGNVFEPAAGGFSMKYNAVTIFGRTPGDAKPEVADAQQWNNADALFASAKGAGGAAPALPVIVGHVPLVAEPRLLSLQHLGTAAVPADLQVVTGDGPEAPPATVLLAAFKAEELPKVFANAESHFKVLRERVAIDTPDPYINAAAAALNVAADAVWDESQHAIMHGAVAWRQKLLGWRGPYALDDLGWHDRAAENFATWAPKQNTKPIPPFPGADEGSNLSRSEAALHTNGDMSNSHYDMNMVHIDAAFRHILWTGDLNFAKTEWPIIQRHLAWEQRSFRRTYGPEKLPLYEAYAAIWASDDLQYNGSGTAHASAYNYYHNKMAARVAKLVGADAAPYEKEAELIAKAMRQYLWIADKGEFAEYRDLLGLQLAHESAALWTFYHTVDSEVPDAMEAWQMASAIQQSPHVPVKGAGVPSDQPYALLPTTTWMPYLWSLNNVNMNENAHAALALFQANRIDDGARLLKSGLLASMYMGISPGNIGTMTYLDVYRRESQRDFGDACGTLSRAMVEGLFGIRPDGINGKLNISPGYPETWDHASMHHPDFSYSFKRTGQTDTITIESHFPNAMGLRLYLPIRRDDLSGITLNGQPASPDFIPRGGQPQGWGFAYGLGVGTPRMYIAAAPQPKWEINIEWKGNPLTPAPATINVVQGQPVTVALPEVLTPVDAPERPAILDPRNAFTQVKQKDGIAGFEAIANTVGHHTVFLNVKQGRFAWQMPIEINVAARTAQTEPPFDWSKPEAAAKFESVDLSKFFNDSVTQIFKHEYRTPRSPGVSLAIPKTGLGAWAGDSTATANIDDRGLRAEAARNNGKILMPNGAPFATPGAATGNNIIFTSQWDNFPKEVKVPLTGKAKRVLLLMAGSTYAMQSRFDNGEVTVTYTDGTTAKLLLNNPVNWWPIEQDYFIDDYQFKRPEAIPPRVNLLSGQVRLLDVATFKGKGGKIAGGAATALDLALDPAKELQSLTVHTLANEVVVGLMAATLVR